MDITEAFKKLLYYSPEIAFTLLICLFLAMIFTAIQFIYEALTTPRKRNRKNKYKDEKRR